MNHKNVDVILDKMGDLITKNNIFEVEKMYTKLQKSDVPEDELLVINESIVGIYKYLAANN